MENVQLYEIYVHINENRPPIAWQEKDIGRFCIFQNGFLAQKDMFQLTLLLMVGFTNNL